jgi:hypothetical protein
MADVVYSYTGLFSMKKRTKKKKKSLARRLRDRLGRFASRSENWIRNHQGLISTGLALANLGINTKIAFGGVNVNQKHAN